MFKKQISASLKVCELSSSSSLYGPSSHSIKQGNNDIIAFNYNRRTLNIDVVLTNNSKVFGIAIDTLKEYAYNHGCKFIKYSGALDEKTRNFFDNNGFEKQTIYDGSRKNVYLQLTL